ncbi:MAG: Glutamine--scyllo-inositol transaminase [Solirubrobacterales bacterium]|nr:Glutamine--scyllo-inositol transaminase [Solirubrobacterales bacterium]
MSVPLFDAATPRAPLREGLRSAIDRVLESERFVLGPEVASFERELAAYCGASQAVGVANGTDAITITLRAMGAGPGDEVIVPSFTFYASVEAIVHTGATPVFCDIDADTYCITPETVRAALTPRTKAVIAVHLFGNVAPVGEIQALGVPVLEDAAQAMGSRSAAGRPGSLGVAATFSFYPSKNLACFGDGGAIVTNDDAIAEEARILRFHGSRDKIDYEQVGYNSRLDELQAAILRVQLPHLDQWSDGRMQAARNYEEAGLAELASLPKPVAGASPAWHLYVVSHPDVKRLEGALAAAQVGYKPYYRTPVHRQAPMLEWGAGVDLPATEHAARTHLAIPMSPGLTRAQADEVVAAARAAS